MTTRFFLACALLTCAPLTSAAFAQATTDDHPLVTSVLPLRFDSGEVRNLGKARGVAYSAIVRAEQRGWLRLQFDIAALGSTPPGGQPTILRLTSLLDGGVQTMNAMHVQQWQNSSAYFNGDAVQVEIVCDPEAPPSRLTMSMLMAGDIVPLDEGGIATICFGVDDRVLSTEPGAARHLPEGCTSWIINDPNRTFLTAGHCGISGGDVIQFNVPLSIGCGNLVNPPPEDQYAVDSTSVQSLSGTVGGDWCYYGCFPNTNTGLTPFEAQGQFYTLAAAAPPVGTPAQGIRITGYGTVSSPVPPAWCQVQKTHTGPYFSQTGTTVRYQTDTTGGNSGSPVFDMETQTAIGIHTHGFCTATGDANSGTAIHHPGLQNALANPLGVCIPNPAIDFTYPDGLPVHVQPAGDTIRVQVIPGNGGTPAPGTGMLHVDTGSGFVAVPMQEISANVYDAPIPVSTCLTTIRYYFAAEDSGGATITDPLNAPGAFFSTLSAVAVSDSFNDNFQTNQGWTVTNSAGLTTGTWQRVIPTATGSRVPTTDADGSGMCYVTDNGQNNDVDGGSTTLTSPLMDSTAQNATLSYWRWFSTSGTASGDSMLVQVSDDDGATWVQLENYSASTTGWIHREYSIASIAGITPSAAFRIRFTVADIGSASTVEGAVDGVMIRAVECAGATCLADIVTGGASNGVVDIDDLLAVISAWGPCPAPPAACAANIVTSGASATVVDIDDLLAVISAWGPCP